jgi:exopolysaccharide biosynthesis polyprenyl glycosylphosphotransferase
LLTEHVVDEVIFDVNSSKLPSLEGIFLQCDEEGIRTRVAVDFFPHVNSEITLDRVGGAPLLTFSAAPLDDLRLLLKRLFDIVISATALVVLAPFFAFVAIAIKLTSPGPVIFRQSRCGLNGRRFTMYKFRSMVEDAESMKSGFQHLSHRQVAFKLFQDPRVTPFGRWIRKFSIDELPQLYNVLRGDMSIVGPRPPVPEEVDRYERWQRRRLRMRPGLTCLWAVSGRDRIDFNTWMRLDISYIENWSLQLDWSIILRTIPHVLAGKGAH